MRAKYSHIFLLFFVLLFSAIQSPAQQESVFKKFAGTYVTGHEFGGGSIKLETDGTFSDFAGSDDGTSISLSGNYTLLDGVLHFKIMKQTVKRRDENGFPTEKKEMFGGASNGEIQREVEYLPIEWSGRIYLLDESELKNFANAINLGIEPRSSLISESETSPWYGSFYLRSGDEQKKVTGNPNLPEKWLSFLLHKPLTAAIINVQIVEKREFSTLVIVTINKGSKDGLKVGMRLLSKDEEPSPSDGREVISVEKETAKIQAILVRNKLKAGDKLSTKYKPRMPYR